MQGCYDNAVPGRHLKDELRAVDWCEDARAIRNMASLNFQYYFSRYKKSRLPITPLARLSRFFKSAGCTTGTNVTLLAVLAPTERGPDADIQCSGRVHFPTVVGAASKIAVCFAW
jgi:hypothetical protein